MPSSSEPNSNWDFTPVINLLRSPTSHARDQPVPDKPYADASIPPSASRKVTDNDVKNLNTEAQPLDDTNYRSPKLGDFGCLWELLGTASGDNGCHSEVQIAPSKQRPHAPKPIVILKRPKPTDASVEKPVSTARTPLQPIPALNISKSGNSAAHRKTKVESSTSRQQPRQQSKTVYESSSCESSAGGESDGYLSVFDPPLSKTRVTPSKIPPLVCIAEASSEALETPPSSFDESDEFLTPNAVKHLSDPGTIRVQPLAYKTAADQRVGLLTKLLKDFPDYAERVVQIGRPPKSSKKDIPCRPIHVFVDMSNIMVGFHDSMKVSRNIPVKTWIRRLPLSFQNFSLILERGRPAAKRVLVGSDRLASIKEGEQLGYEANILDRVHKVKHPTTRPLKFRKTPRATAQAGGHGSETNDVAGERWVEQGVDEILHLKILESLVDTDEPATIVLATGDAAEAEFSGGFMKMVERALHRGWRVELVSFSQVTSYAYRKKEFRSRWGSQFQMIALDDYVEELLDI